MRQQNVVQPNKPWLVYYAPGTAHAPHQAPRDWIDRFKGQFDQGWDKVREQTLAREISLGTVPAGTRLSARPAEIPAWDSLPADKRQLYARMMEVYAGAVAYADNQIGRVIEEIDRAGELNNTLIVFVEGDNGSSAEGGANGLFNELAGLNEENVADLPVAQAHVEDLGGPKAYGHFPAGWAHAMSAPFPYFKRVASHLGAARNAMVLSWPKRAPLAQGQIRNQYHHVIDIVPTILEASGIKPPQAVGGVRQMRFDGTSMLYSLDGGEAKPSTRRVQFYELAADAAIYADGWLANTRPAVMPWQFTGIKDIPFAQRQWELYDLRSDFSQSHDLAAEHPGKLRQLQKLFQREAKANLALPIARTPPGLPAPDPNTGRREFIYPAGVTRISSSVAPDVRNRSFSLQADLTVPHGAAHGMLVTQGGRFGGYALYLNQGVPRFVYNKLGLESVAVDWGKALSPGRHVIRLDFDYDGGGIGKGGTARLSVDGAQARGVRVPSTMRLLFPLSETFDVGADTGTAVAEDYRVPFRLEVPELKVTVTLR